MSSNTTKSPQTENSLGSTIVLFALMMVLFAGAIYSLSFLTLENPWPMAVCLVPLRPGVLDPADAAGPLGLGRRKLGSTVLKRGRLRISGASVT